MKLLRHNLIAICLWSHEPALAETEPGVRIVQAIDQDQVNRFGEWNESRFCFAKTASLQTAEAGTPLQFGFEGTAVVCDKAGTTCRASQFNINRLRSSTNKTLPLCSTASGSIALQAVTYSGSATSKTYYADASPGVLECACCGKSNVNTSGSLPVFSISTPPLESAAWVMNPISG